MFGVAFLLVDLTGSHPPLHFLMTVNSCKCALPLTVFICAYLTNDFNVDLGMALLIYSCCVFIYNGWLVAVLAIKDSKIVTKRQ